MLATIEDCDVCGLYHSPAESCKDAVRKLEARVQELENSRKEEIEQAFMAGQAREGVDPSYSEAQSYYEEWKAQKEGM